MHASTLEPKTDIDDQSKNINMPFWDHVSDLRKLIIKCILSICIGCVIAASCFPFCAKIMNFPLIQAAQGNTEIIQGLVTTSPMGIFSVLIQICLLGGMGLALPFILFFIAGFISPALNQKEKKIIFPLGISAFFLFIIGSTFSYFWVLPASLVFAMELNQIFGFKLIWSAPHYYNLVVWMTIGIGLCFEFPLIILALLASNLVSVQTFKNIRRYMIVGILIVGAAIIPGGDPISLLLLAGPLYASYEIIIIIGQKMEKKRLKNNKMNII